MTKRMKKYSGKALATTGIMLVIGVLVWAWMAFAFNANVATYSDATYTTTKTDFARGIDKVYTNMTGGIATKTYYAEYWGPRLNNSTTIVFKPGRRYGPLTSRVSGGVSHFMNTSSTDAAGAGWQARILHNPN